MHQMTDFDGERFMIKVRFLAVWKNLVHENQVTKCNVTVHQTPHVFSDSPSQNLASFKTESKVFITKATVTFQD